MEKNYRQVVVLNLFFLPNYKIVFILPCSMEKARDALAGNLLLPGSKTFLYGMPIGFLKDNRFSLHFAKSTRNLFRPEYHGTLVAKNDQVKVTIICEVSKIAKIATPIHLLLCAILIFATLIGSKSGQPTSEKISWVFTGFLFLLMPWLLFFKGISQDKNKLKSLFTESLF